MRVCVCAIMLVMLCGSVMAQGALSDIMSGKLINPEVGVFAWYDLKDAATGQRLFMRQAIVGKKQVGSQTGYYLETEVMPEIGFPIIYKMLLTGPASDPANVHEIVVKDGMHPAETLPVNMLEDAVENDEPETRESQGVETVSTPAGAVEAEHFLISKNDAQTELWVNDDIRPMGIVKMVNADGELVLNRFGTGGPDAESALDRKIEHPKTEDIKVRISPGPAKNFSGRSAPE